MRTIASLLAISFIRLALAQSVTPASFASTQFDVIIVGGGTAGLVVANRLSATFLRVGVIDAGTFDPNGDPIIDIPTAGNIYSNQPSSSLIFNPKYDWIMMSVPQNSSDGTVIAYNRGKVLGGSSAINNMVWTRGQRSEYDAWAAFGNGKDWTFDGMLPYFKRSETWTPPPSGNGALIPGTTPAASMSSAHGTNGPIRARYNTFFTDLERPVAEASANLGLPLNPNPDAGESMYLPLNGITDSIDPVTEKRSYSASGYYGPDVRARRNLVVLTNAVVSRITWDRSTLGSRSIKATGVEYVVNGQTFTVKASKEVILAAGSLKTPQVLELSGVGNAALLRSLSIPVTLDFPQVGENLMDHPMSFTDFQVKPGVLTLDRLLFNATYAAQQKTLYDSSHKGAFTAAATLTGALPLKAMVSNAEWRRMRSELDAEIASKKLTPLQKAQYSILLKLFDQGKVGQSSPGVVARGGIASPSAPETGYLTLAIFQLHELARGSVHINSNDPNASPLIDPKFMSFKWDLDVQSHAVQFLRKLTQTPPLSNIIASLSNPPASVQTDAQWADFVKKNLATISHPMGTTAMASKSLGGVVDNRLSVYGLSNVRIVDAGVIPFTIGCPIQSTVYMVAEKAAEMIIQDLRPHH